MICPRCADAANRQAGRDQHCRDVGCTCGHRVERYGEVGERIAGHDEGEAVDSLRGG